ncbi:hypothetical protein JQU17_05995 [Ponticoccus sp. SC2-23]|uniref:hypothetical protein n=1 Tax=Alexandriicola marinus TaxID=2081710 RepID=UPI000FD87A60|nr:hypothetical protein [Alexandriicola marinus]MBM1219741.1 hypothetical protein [Ponticoccus sp. SC6-9]MBM1223187.1 hypothetical protein [Ponticoccus sp. SC6-15]MBM1229554.1 hypothetical protein [Ponticoccus sp. SC6-38]MBM1232153.1 hypothetical protein [Ponticoccus sp. SC6-45]MBM1237897.1 hypothetical protein [Ponticoccus sp. SC6-49]MBM1241164.1 hypothetical protein [Ponticoccus sp. SC2-64]MBM1245677.1 hypothetical protein [Ponticoccus sp. SC6-42]MBM1250155.1 hypothetical protein [Pontico
MTPDPYRHRVTALAVTTSAAFFGANAFIGLSMGAFWLTLPAADFVAQFFRPFSNFLYTIMPLFLALLVGLIMSARLDRDLPEARHNWRRNPTPGSALRADEVAAFSGKTDANTPLAHDLPTPNCTRISP